MIPNSAIEASARLGEQFRRWRLVRELPAADVADRAGITISTLRSIERGEGSGVRLGAVLAVADVLGFSEQLLAASDPLNTEIGRLRADRMLRKRAPR